ncbi:glucuronyl esterase domain-containing protein [Hellea balneolensis]|uniref:glucuronyl esterase domain-containing protein n=1 Tax=Hellea balneolensis TaxID=287478 RepID=UPI0006883931|nr:hypothetical protein [Hellea balneolensis]
MRFLKMKRVWLAIAAILTFAALSSCAGTRTLMMTAPSKPVGQEATPKIASSTVKDWEKNKPLIRSVFEKEVYGILPNAFNTTLIESREISGHSYKANIQEITLNAPRGLTYNAVLLMPKNAAKPVPIIMMENFCPNHNVVPIDGISKPKNDHFECSGDSMMSGVFTYFFGRYITTPPINMIMDRGYALAVIYPPANYPDDAAGFEPFRQEAPSSAQPWGAVGAWAFQFSTLSNFLKSDERFSETISFGHSRYGKAALVAAAFDETIDGVIAHQSGTGGASLSRNKKGETVKDITENYPHWFTPGYAEQNLTVDQHQLLGLIAPRPILLGNAKRDVWSDPEGAFRAAQGASPVYELYGAQGLEQTKLTEFMPQNDLAFWIRPGTHGVVKEDWPAFLEFMDAHFK